MLREQIFFTFKKNEKWENSSIRRIITPFYRDEQFDIPKIANIN